MILLCSASRASRALALGALLSSLLAPLALGASSLPPPLLYALDGAPAEVLDLLPGASLSVVAIARGEAHTIVAPGALACVTLHFESLFDAVLVGACVSPAAVSAVHGDAACLMASSEKVIEGGALLRRVPLPVNATPAWSVSLASESKAAMRVAVTASAVPCSNSDDVEDEGSMNVFELTAGAADSSSALSQVTPPTPLTKDLPILGSIIAPGAYSFYSFTPSQPGSSPLRFTFAVTPFTGDPDLYVSTTNPNPKATNSSSFCRSATGMQRDVVEIIPSSPCYCASCTYYISVLNAGGSGGTTFSVLASEGDSTPYPLVDGVPQAGILGQGETDYFTLVLPPLPSSSSRRRVSVTLAPFLGDPDLYISFAPDFPGPSRSDYSSLNAQGPDLIVMRDSDPQWIRNAAIPPPKGSLCRNAMTTCSINIAIYAFSPAIYSISAYAQAPAMLQNGVSILGSVDAGGFFTYFSFNASSNPNDAVIITLDPLYGDPDIFVGSSNSSTTMMPTQAPGSYYWRGTTMGQELIFIDPTDEHFCGACTYYAGVTGFGSNASFSIMARTRNSSAVRLEPGVPVLDIVEPRAYARYTALLDRALGYLEVTVSPMNGDPDLYISFDGPPTRESFQFSSLSATGDEDIRVSLSDPRVNATCTTSNATVCVANIAVFGYPATGASSQYTIVASDGLRILYDGVGTVGQVPAGLYTYFVIETNGGVGGVGSPLSITVSPLGGMQDPDLFVSTTNPRPTSAQGKYAWSSTGASGSAEVITIDPSDPKIVCPFRSFPCRFYIGVLAWGAFPARFAITARTAGYITLAAGVPSISSIAPNVLTYFSLAVPPNANLSMGLEFAFTPLDGAADSVMYIGNTVNPSTGRTIFPSCADPPTCNTIQNVGVGWTSTSSLTRTEVFIPPTDLALLPGRTYIAAIFSALGGPSLSLTATYGNSWKPLTPSVPSVDSVSRRAFSYWRVVLSSSADVSILLTPTTGDADLYVSISPTNTFPTNINYDKASARTAGTEIVTFSAAELSAPTRTCETAFSTGAPCAVWVAVYGFSAAAYSIVATVTPTGGGGRTNGIELLDGVAQGGSLSRQTLALYYADIALAPGATYSFYVRSVVGDVDLYVTTDGSIPVVCCPRNYAYSSTAGYGDDYVNVAPNTDGYNVTTRAYALLYGFMSSNYTITFSTASAVVMVGDGTSVTGSLPGGTYAYYALALPDPSVTVPVSFALTARSGDTDAYVMVWPFSQPRLRPTTSQYTWAGESFGSDVINILPKPTDANACHGAGSYANGRCTYIIGIYCAQATPCRYSLTGSIGGVIPLVDGEPLSNSLASPSQYVYFSFDASGRAGDDRDVLITLTSSQGGSASSLRLYVTNAYDSSTQPPSGALPNAATPSSYQWSDANSATPGTISILASDPARTGAPGYGSSVFTIGVTGLSSSTPGVMLAFTITAASSAASTGLQPGVPSPQRSLPNGANHRFYALLGDTSEDLVLTATLLYGSVTIAVSYFDPLVSCSAPRTCSPNATWTSVVTRSVQMSSTVRIYAPQPPPSSVGPCTGPYVVATAPCNPATAWRSGFYYIAVYGVAPSTYYTLTFQTSAAYTRLADGVPAAGQLNTGSLPPVFAYTIGRDLTLPDVRFILNVDAPSSPSSTHPFWYYVRSCVDVACTPLDQTPSASNAQASGLLQRGATSDFFLTKFLPAYCSPTSASSQCTFFVSLVPSVPYDCPAGVDDACGFTIAAQLQSGAGRTTVSYSSINGGVFSLIGNVPAGNAAVVELYLDRTSTAEITMDLEACGPGFPTLFVCNPKAASGQPCAMPSLPSATSNTGSSVTFPSGIGRYRERVVGTDVYFLALAATSTDPAPAPATKTNNWQYQISLSAGAAFYLAVPLNATIAASTPTDGGTEAATSLNVSWPRAVIVDQDGKAYSKLPVGVTYNVYAAPSGFNGGSSAGSGSIPTTPCGLIRWSLQPWGTQPTQAATPDALWAIVGGLQPSSSAELNVVAICDRACWTATLKAMVTEEEEEEEEEASFLAHPRRASSVAPSKAAAAEALSPQCAAVVASQAAVAAGAALAHQPDSADTLACAHAIAEVSAAASESFAVPTAAEADALYAAKYLSTSSSRRVSSSSSDDTVPRALARVRALAALERMRVAEEEEEGAEGVSIDASLGDGGLGVPGYITQRAAYWPLTATTSNGAAAPTERSTALPPAAIAGLVLGGVALLTGVFLGVRYVRARAAGSAPQYAALDISSAMSTISVPSGKGGFEDVDNSSLNSSGVRGGSGRGWMSKVFGGGGGGGGANRTALADSEYSEADDAAARFL